MPNLLLPSYNSIPIKDYFFKILYKVKTVRDITQGNFFFEI
jgi:hypothetical protein